jgi:MFS family permease
MRELGAEPQWAGFILGGLAAVSGFLGVILGGRMADHLRRTMAAGRILVIAFGLIAPIPFLVIAFTTDSLTLFYAMQFPAGLFAASALGATAATTQDLVLPRMRGAATATFFLGTTLIGLALGPYLAGKISVVTGSLATGNLALLAAVPISMVCLFYSYRAVPREEASLLDRARAAGEAV